MPTAPAKSNRSASEVKDFKRGDRVYIAGDNVSVAGAGTYAEHALCSRAQLHRLPPRVSFGQGAASASRTRRRIARLFIRASARPAETVLVHGATGGVGIAAVQIARAHGMRVIGSGGTDADWSSSASRAPTSWSTIASRTIWTRS